MSLRLGRRSMTLRGNGNRSRNDTNDIKRQQPLNQGVRIGEVVLKYGDVRSIAEHRPIGALKRHLLVIVQSSDLALLHWHPPPGDSLECLSGLTLAFATRSIAKSKSEDGNFSFIVLIRLSASLAFLSSFSKTNK